MSFSILEDYDKGDDLGMVAADFALFKELGVTTWRGSFGWDDYEPSRGNYDFDWLNRFIHLAQENGISLRPYVGYTPEWAAKSGGADQDYWNNPPVHLQDWGDFMHELSSNVQNDHNVLSFEIYNEENARSWWDGSEDEYIEVLKTARNAVHQQIITGGLTYPDLNWMDRLCESASKDFDIVALHAYPETWSGKNTVVENYLDHFFTNTFLPAVHQDCGPKPVWINEMGFPTTPGKHSEKDQANWWARAFATFLAAPAIEHLGIYEIKEPKRASAVIGEQENYYLGILTEKREKKLAFYTIRSLAGLFNSGQITIADVGTRVNIKEGERGELYMHRFISSGKQIVFVWDKSGSPTVEIEIPESIHQVREMSLNGSSSEYPYHRQTIRTKLTAGDVRIFEID